MVKEAEARAAAAEGAKIQLSLALAEAADQRGKDMDVLTPAKGGSLINEQLTPPNSVTRTNLSTSSPQSEFFTPQDSSSSHGLGSTGLAHVRDGAGDSKDLFEDLQRRLEEADLAATVQTRRAAAAEAELTLLRAQLEEAQSQVKQLSWQIKMTMEPGTLGGRLAEAASGDTAGSSKWLDLMGCGANFKRK